MDYRYLLASVCLVFVIEGLMPMVAPRFWKRLIARFLDTPEKDLRIGGAIMIALGLLALQWVRNL